MESMVTGRGEASIKVIWVAMDPRERGRDVCNSMRCCCVCTAGKRPGGINDGFDRVFIVQQLEC